MASGLTSSEGEVNSEIMEVVNSFNYLGSCFDRDGRRQGDLKVGGLKVSDLWCNEETV